MLEIKKYLFSLFEQFGKKQAINFGSDDESTTEIHESTRLEEDHLSENTSKITDGIFLTEKWLIQSCLLPSIQISHINKF